jgi:hypothetical protein
MNNLNQLKSKLGNQIWYQLRNQLMKHLWAQLWIQLRDQLPDQLGVQFWSNLDLRNQIENQLKKEYDE